VLSGPDNLTLAPRGGLVVCEDGSNRVQRLIAVSHDGRATELARNAVVLDAPRNGLLGDFRDKEWSGVSFSPDGRWLFANLQAPGVSFAITGPWRKLGL
jgi:secreted PhoX family phosphatase